MKDGGDKLSQLLDANLKMDRWIDRLGNVKELTRIIHDGRVNNSRSVEIALAIVKFVKEG